MSKMPDTVSASSKLIPSSAAPNTSLGLDMVSAFPSYSSEISLSSWLYEQIRQTTPNYAPKKLPVLWVIRYGLNTDPESAGCMKFAQDQDLFSDFPRKWPDGSSGHACNHASASILVNTAPLAIVTHLHTRMSIFLPATKAV